MVTRKLIRPGTEKVRILKKPKHRISRLDIDPDALKIIYRLNSQGFVAYLTGGAVQNLMQGITPKDFDLVTDARPGQIKKRFRNAFIIGRRFRLAHIHFKDGKYIEVATFRREPDEKEEDTLDPAHRYQRTYGTPLEDAFRRDITINALYYDVDTESVIDYVGGLKDLAARKIRVMGNPGERYTEDPVRILRVIRHAVRLGFEIEKKTEYAIRSHRHLLADVAGARLFEELNKDLTLKTPLVFEAYQKYGVLKYILGQAGEAYDKDRDLFSRAKSLLEIRDAAESGTFQFSREELFALMTWPWVESLLSAGEADTLKNPHETIPQALAGSWLTKGLRADSIQILILNHYLMQALRTGRMRWAWQRRSHYEQASRLCFLIEKGRPPQGKDPFAGLFHSQYPSTGTKRRRQRRRKPRGRSQDGPDTGRSQTSDKKNIARDDRQN